MPGRCFGLMGLGLCRSGCGPTSTCRTQQLRVMWMWSDCSRSNHELEERLADQDLSFERIAATARLLASGADEQLVDSSCGFDLAGVRRLRNRQRRVTRTDERDVFVDRHSRLQDSLDGNRGRFSGELPGFEFSIFSKAVEERADMFGDLPARYPQSRSGWLMVGIDRTGFARVAQPRRRPGASVRSVGGGAGRHQEGG